MIQLILRRFACIVVVVVMTSVWCSTAILGPFEDHDNIMYETPSIQFGRSQNEDISLFHTVKITIHRLLEEDFIDFLGLPDWYYAVGVSEDFTNWNTEISPIPIVDEQADVIVDTPHHFTCEIQTLTIFIALIDYDSLDADDVADISSRPGGGGSISGPLTRPSSYPEGAIFVGTYHLSSHTLIGDDYVGDGPWLKTSGTMDGSTATDEDDASLWFSIEEVTTYPIEVRIHKIRALDYIDIGTGADWYYMICASTNGGDWEYQYSPEPIATDRDTLVVDASHMFFMNSTLIDVAIVLFEDDLLDDDLADISSYTGGGVDDFPGGPIPDGAYFLTRFDWNTNTLDPTYDTYIEDTNWYFKTSGEFDGSTDVDENDAELWFRIFSLPPKVLDYGPVGTNVNDASSIGIIFSARMDNLSVESSFSILPQIEGEFHWNNDSTSIFFVPDSPLTCSQSYVATLSVDATDLSGLHIESPVMWTFSVEDNEAPVASAGEDQTTELFKLVTFDASQSFDFTGEITGYEWDFGDGTTTTGVRVQHAYFQAKDFQASLTVTDNYGLSSIDTMDIHVEKGNFAPQNLIYDFAFYWDYFSVNVTTNLNMSLSTGIDQLVDLSSLGITNIRAVETEFLGRDYEYEANETGLTDGSGRDWNYINLKTSVQNREYLRTLSGFPVRTDSEVVMEFWGEISDGTTIYDRVEFYEVELTEPISIKLSDTPQASQELNLWHSLLLKYSRYYAEDGNVVIDAEGDTHLFAPFQRKHRIQPLGSQYIITGDETVKAYGFKDTYQDWNPYEIVYAQSLFSPYLDIIIYGDISLDEGWIESTLWFADTQQMVLLEEVIFEMNDNGFGNPDVSTRSFLEYLSLSRLRDRIELSDGDNIDEFSTDYETIVRIHEPWAHARLKLGGNETHEAFLNFDLVYDVILEHEGYVTFNHHVSGKELERAVQSTILSSYDEFQLFLEPHFDISMESWDIQTGELYEVYFYLELPVPTLEDVDGDGISVNVLGQEVYIWDNPALLWSSSGNDLTGTTSALSRLSVTLAKIDLLAVIEYLSKSMCPPCALFLKIIGWFVGLYINFNLNVDADFYYLIGTYSETNGTFGSGGDVDLQWFGFESPVGESAHVSNELSIDADLGETVGTKIYRLVKSHVDATVWGSINFETVLFPGTLFEMQLCDIPILEGGDLTGSSDAYSFVDTYLYHEFMGSDDTPPVSEVSSLPNFSTDQVLDIHSTANDELSGVKEVILYYRLNSENWTEYGIFEDGYLSFSSPGDGYYEFYSIAVDNWENVEEPPVAADTSTHVDTIGPVIDVPPSVSVEDVGSTLEWDGTDETSGIDHYEVRVDNGEFEDIGTNTSYPLTGLTEGPHYLIIRAFDNAGNYEETAVKVTSGSGEQNEGDLIWSSGFAIAIVIVIVLLLTITATFILVRRKRAS